jgi:hypothetical protein
MSESITSFANRIRNNPEVASKYGNIEDDTALVNAVVSDHPIYQYRFQERTIKGNFFTDAIKQSILGFAETPIKSAAGYTTLGGALLAEPTMSEEEFAQSEKSKSGTYEDYVRFNELKLDVQDKALDVSDSFLKFVNEDLPAFLQTNTLYAQSPAGS